MNAKAAFLFTLTIATLAGCAVGPNYHPPKMATPTNWGESAQGGVTNSSVQIVQWWKTFQDPELNSLVERAVAANHDLRIADGRLRQARAVKSGVFWNLGPTINGSAGYTDARQAMNSLPIRGSGTNFAYLFHTDLYDAHFDASWEIDVFGGKRRALQEANALVSSVEEERHDVLVSVLAEVARNYIEVRNFQQRLAIVRENLAAQGEAVGIARARFHAGLSSELDVKQAEALLATTESRIPTLETSLKQSIHALSVLLGQPPAALLGELGPDAPIPATPPEVPVGLPSDLLRRRPDVRRAERELAAATADVGVQTAEMFPKFSLTGVGGFQSFAASDWFSGGSKYWSAGPTMTWRIFDLGHVRSQIRAANAVQEQVLAAYEKTVLTSFEEVENALVAYAREQTRHHSLQEAVEANRGAVEISNQLYKNGLTSFLNVVEAERSLYQAEDDLVQSERTVTIDLVALYKALGGGWESLANDGTTKPQAKL